jgi:hypothetical protein
LEYRDIVWFKIECKYTDREWREGLVVGGWKVRGWKVGGWIRDSLFGIQSERLRSDAVCLETSTLNLVIFAVSYAGS